MAMVTTTVAVPVVMVTTTIAVLVAMVTIMAVPVTKR